MTDEQPTLEHVPTDRFAHGYLEHGAATTATLAGDRGRSFGVSGAVAVVVLGALLLTIGLALLVSWPVGLIMGGTGILALGIYLLRDAQGLALLAESMRSS